VVVSEETGQMAVAHTGRLIRNLDQDRLRRVLRTLLRLDRPEGTGAAPTGRFALPFRFHSNGVEKTPAATRRRDSETVRTP